MFISVKKVSENWQTVNKVLYNDNSALNPGQNQQYLG